MEGLERSSPNPYEAMRKERFAIETFVMENLHDGGADQ